MLQFSFRILTMLVIQTYDVAPDVLKEHGKVCVFLWEERSIWVNNWLEFRPKTRTRTWMPRLAVSCITMV